MAIVDHSGIPLALCVTSATPHESQLVEETLRQRHIKDKPIRMVGDKAYDSDPLDARLAKRHRIEVIAPNKSNRKRRTQDGRSLRRYRGRWRVERFLAWLQSQRRLIIRYEYYDWIFQSLVQLAAVLILFKFLGK